MDFLKLSQRFSRAKKKQLAIEIRIKVGSKFGYFLKFAKNANQAIFNHLQIASLIEIVTV